MKRFSVAAVGFLLGFSRLGLAADNSINDNAPIQKYIVKVAPAHGFDAQDVDDSTDSNRKALATERLADATNNVADEIFDVEGVVDTKPLEKSGYVFVDVDASNKDLMRDALERNPNVVYFEPDRQNIHLDSNADAASATIAEGYPSQYSKSPWLRDVLGFPDPATGLSPKLGYAEGCNTTTKVPNYPSVKVAVIDTGANVNNKFLRSAMAYNECEVGGAAATDNDNNGYKNDVWGWNTTNNSADITETGTDHGSHVSGIVKSVRDQAAALYGAPGTKVEILPIRFISETGVGSTSAAIDAIEYARVRKAKVINASWGAKGTDAFSQALYDAFVRAYNSDIVVVVAAGNSEGGFQNDNDKTPYFPASFNIPSLVTIASISAEYTRVGSTDTLTYNSLSDFSNYGANSVDFAAPGGYKSVDGDSTGIWSANAHFDPAHEDSTLYIRKKGTSMATPVVAGIAGVVRSLNPSLTAYEVVKVLEDAVVVSDKMKKYTRVGGYVSATKAFQLALSRGSSNLKPDVPSDPYSTFSASSASTTSSSRKGGGCGTVSGPVIGPGSGPFGGNSILLFTAVYLAAQAVRARQRKVRARQRK